MNAKTFLLIPAALALGAPSHAYAYIGFGLNLSIPLYYPVAGRPAAFVSQAPPQAVSEQVTPAPGPGYVWMSGHWSFYGQKWVWVAGHWELPPSPSAAWIGGHWVQGNSGWVWVDGAWTVGAPPSPPRGPPAPPDAPPSAAPRSAPMEGPPAPPTATSVPSPSSPPPSPEMEDGAVVGQEPPAEIAEYIPAAPYPGYVWIGGFWGWRGGWYWNAGHFARPPLEGRRMDLGRLGSRSPRMGLARRTLALSTGIGADGEQARKKIRLV